MKFSKFFDPELFNLQTFYQNIMSCEGTLFGYFLYDLSQLFKVFCFG